MKLFCLICEEEIDYTRNVVDTMSINGVRINVGHACDDCYFSVAGKEHRKKGLLKRLRLLVRP